MINLAVVIPNYNGLHYLPECLKSLDDQDFPVEVIIVDNGSRDGSVDYIKENSDKFKENHGEFTLIENQENLGFSKAINQGINTTNAEYVFLLNNDVELEPGCISNLVECIKQDDMIFSVASMMVQFEDRGKLDDAGDEYTILGWTKKAGEGKSPDKYRKRREIFSSCAGAALYRKSILDKIGYFDENFFAYMEDVDISYRARIHGFKCVYCPEAVVYHRGSGTSGSRYNEFKIRLAARNNVYVPYKNMPWPQLAVNFIFLLAGYLIKYLFFYRKRQEKFYIEGLKEGFNSLDKIEKVRYDKENLGNYFKIEWLLIKNVFQFLH